MYKTHTEVTKEPCIAENREPPKTPATPSIWNGCIKNKVGSKKNPLSKHGLKLSKHHALYPINK
jgi:hypothetical protein